MKPEEVFKRYDVRGEYPEEINEKFAERMGKALGTFVKTNYSSKIVISRDNKDSSKILKEAMIEGLLSTGLKVIDVGEGPTDYAAYSGMKKKAVSAQITSSHLPLDFNGFKMMYTEGNGFVNKDLNTVKDIFRQENFSEGEGSIKHVEEDLKKLYREDIKSKASELGKEGFEKKVVVDTLGGATKDLLPELLRELGAEVIDLGEEKDKYPYRDPPNPKPENLSELEERVKEENADLGLATDMDADRVTVHDGERFLSGDEIFGLLAQETSGDIVASIDTSKALEDFQAKEGGKIFYTRVGDPFVMEKALEEQVELAGEPNGHYSVLDFVPYNSGTLAALALAGMDIDEGLEELPEYEVERFSFRTEEKEKMMEKIKEAVEKHYEVISEVDGVKFATENCDVLVRPSGSSPKIRVIAESEDSEGLSEDMDEIREIVQNP